jgi:hypothetical protein
MGDNPVTQPLPSVQLSAHPPQVLNDNSTILRFQAATLQFDHVGFAAALDYLSNNIAETEFTSRTEILAALCLGDVVRTKQFIFLNLCPYRLIQVGGAL